MSAVFPHARFRPTRRVGLGFARARSATLTLALGLSACSDSAASGEFSAGGPPNAGGGFGSEADDFDLDGGPTDSETPAPGLDGGQGTRAVTFVHGIVNLGAAQVCYRLAAGGAATLLGQAEAFGDFGPMASPLPWAPGVLSLHRIAEESGAPDAGIFQPNVDAQAGGPEDSDAAVPEQDAGTGAIDCAESTQIAGFNLKPSDVLQASQLTLIASGLVLDAERLSEREAEFKADFQQRYPDASEQEATLAARDEVQNVVARIGPQLRLEAAPALATEPGSFHLSLSQLVPDVAPANQVLGAVRLCITAGTLEGAVVPPLSQPPLAFRSQTWLTAPYERDVVYRFRVFGGNTFENAAPVNQDCATTSLVPLADLTVPAQARAAGQALNLIFSGAIAPSAVCAPVDPHAVVKAGCPTPIDTLAPSLWLLPPARP